MEVAQSRVPWRDLILVGYITGELAVEFASCEVATWKANKVMKE
jgi:hypothetical protein